MECSDCGADGSKIALLDVLSPTGIVKLCRSCYREDMVILRRPTTFQLKESEEKPFLRGNYNVFRQEKKEAETEPTTKENLKVIVDRNYEKQFSDERKPRPDLADNFHWVIMKSRRRKKITQAQLAKEISESESAIRMAERGILPEDDYRLVNKLESFLGIKIVKASVAERLPEKEPARIIKFDKSVVHNLTIDDLRKMKEARERSVLENSEDEEKAKLEEEQ